MDFQVEEQEFQLVLKIILDFVPCQMIYYATWYYVLR